MRRALLLAAALILSPVIAIADPSNDYILHCRGCHGPEGAGVPGNVPSLRGQMGRFLRVEGGREFLVQVPGAAQSELNNARLAALLNWMLIQFSPDETAAGFQHSTEDEIARLRHPLADVESVRRRLVQ